jgi:drug/metabolite transporter (DMT)-like permease
MAMLTPSGLALTSSLTGGASDYLGGSTSRVVGMVPFMFCTQTLSTVASLGWLVASGDRPPDLGTFAIAAAAGVGLAIALGALLQAMVVGTISIVAPVSATGVIVPIIAGVAGGDRPSAAQTIGIIAAVGGVWLVGRPSRHSKHTGGEPGLRLGVLAAAATGLYFWLMAPASNHGAPWAVLVARAVPALLFGIIVVIRRPDLRPLTAGRNVTAIVGSAILGSFSVAFYALATQHGQLAIVSVLGSLYPAITVILAYRLLGERVHRLQQAGIGILVVAVALMAAG